MKQSQKIPINNTNSLLRIFKRLPKPEEQKAVVAELFNGIVSLRDMDMHFLESKFPMMANEALC